MKHVPQDKYNVAWFTLAECISRGEKVRALGVYRLLSHSIEDRAFSKQLEADILLAFQDNNDAVVKYQEAASLYQKSGKTLEALAVYEHLLDLDPDNIDYLDTCLQLYGKLNITSKIVVHSRLLYQALLHKLDFEAAHHILSQLEQLVTAHEVAHEHEQMVFAMLRDEHHDKKMVLNHIKAAISGFIHGQDNRALQKFLSTLEAINQEYAKQAYAMIQKES